MITRYRISFATITFTVLFGLTACKKSHDSPSPKDPDIAEAAVVDRFSTTAGHLMVRNGNNLVAAGQAINFDQGDFLTKGLGPTGQLIEYYNFDVQPVIPAPIYVLFKQGQTSQVSSQLNIINVIPGDPGYNDFWQVFKVTVPSDYVANTVTSLDEIVARGYTIEKTTDLVNCPVVPKNSTAVKRVGSNDAGLTRGWYKGKVVYYFNFFESPLHVTTTDKVPVAPIYVTFNTNPGQPNGGPASGFKTETGTTQTHNVVAALPGSGGYSPLWAVLFYNNSSFANTMNLTTAQMAPLLNPNIADQPLVNCPVAKIQ